MASNVLLLGASGIPGRNILASLLKLKEEAHVELNITVLKRSATASNTASNGKVAVAYLDDFSDIATFADKLVSLRPDVIISALNAEPAPVLDGCVVDAVLEYNGNIHGGTTKKIFFINGYTLDYMHPSVSGLPEMAKQSIQPKIDFANRLAQLSAKNELEYCTIVNASFLDYTLVKGYSAVNLDKKTASLVDGGTATVTGCSLDFVGDVVALVVKIHAAGEEAEKTQIRNKRLRVAETRYSGKTTVECVEKIMGDKLKANGESLADLLAAGKTIRYLNWAGQGAADFSSDGFEFGKDVLKRRSLEEICRTAIANGVQAFEGIGR